MPGAPSQCECEHLCSDNRGPRRQVKSHAFILPAAHIRAEAVS